MGSGGRAAPRDASSLNAPDRFGAETSLEIVG